MLSGTIVIETSTLPLELKLDLRDRCLARGITVLDCPISGTGAQAAAKDISVYASGPHEAFSKCRSVFEGYARSTHYCGEFGNGSRLKFIANLLVAIHTAAAGEAFAREGAGAVQRVQRPLQIRPRAPEYIMDGYHGNAEATRGRLHRHVVDESRFIAELLPRHRLECGPHVAGDPAIALRYEHAVIG